MQPTRDTRQLNWLLAWAVVFCDIGTSVYYVPGILYGHIKDATPFFVLLTTGGFVLLALKYIEIAWRNPEGGGRYHHHEGFRPDVGMLWRHADYRGLFPHDVHLICVRIPVRGQHLSGA